jgi:KDO2-lipid IV(A) lauroyltransferase
MLTYYLLIPVLYFFAYLPSGVLYKLADVVAFVLRVIVGYRNEVVYTNLRNSFPEKSEKVIEQIAKESYTHLADRVVENIRCIAISKKEVNARMQAKNIALLNSHYDSGRNVVLMVGHIAAWEFGGYKLSINCKHHIFGIVSLVKNPRFNKMIQRTRGKMGMQLIPMNEGKNFLAQKIEQLSLGIFISDQSPSNPQNAYWTNFLNQSTAFFTGAERYARLHNCVVVYPKIVQTKRGYYKAELITICEEPNALAENEITEKFVRLLEKQIEENPADWLWSHKRWKHKKTHTDADVKLP